MRKRTMALTALGAILLAGGGWYASLDQETRGLLAAMPTNADVLGWSQPQRDAAFRAMDRLPILAEANRIAPSAHPLPLPAGKPLEIPGVEQYMAGQRAAGLVIIQDGKVRFERYGLGFGAGGRVGKGAYEGVFGWGGAAGTIAFVDPRRKVRATGMVQYMPSNAYGFHDDFGKWVVADLQG